MIRIAALAVVLATAGVGCGVPSSASAPATSPSPPAAPTPPSDHGGYTGHNADVYTVGYRSCYRWISRAGWSLKNGSSAEADRVITQMLSVEQQLDLVTPRSISAFQRGCSDGARVVAGIRLATVETQTLTTSGP